MVSRMGPPRQPISDDDDAEAGRGRMARPAASAAPSGEDTMSNPTESLPTPAKKSPESHHKFVTYLYNIVQCLKGNAYYVTPSPSVAELETAADGLLAANATAKDGGTARRRGAERPAEGRRQPRRSARRLRPGHRDRDGRGPGHGAGHDHQRGALGPQAHQAAEARARREVRRRLRRDPADRARGGEERRLFPGSTASTSGSGRACPRRCGPTRRSRA